MHFLNRLASSGTRKPWVGGHRGERGTARENRLSGFAVAAAQGVEYIETDVRLTADGVPVLHHDRELRPGLPLAGAVSAFTLRQLRSVIELCTLDEAMAWSEESGVPLAFELKCEPGAGMEEALALGDAVLRRIQRRGFQDRCFVFGIHRPLIANLSTADSRLKTALIVPEMPEDPTAVMRDTGAVVYLAFLRGLTQRGVKLLHEAGYLVDGSVVNDRRDLALALALGVDLLESDHPAQLLRWLDE